MNTCSDSNKKYVSLGNNRDVVRSPSRALVKFFQPLLLERREKGVKLMPGMAHASENQEGWRLQHRPRMCSGLHEVSPVM